MAKSFQKPKQASAAAKGKKTIQQPKNAGRKKNKNYLWYGAILLIAAATFYAYYGSTNNDFTNWDDPNYVINNPLIKELNKTNLHRIFTEKYFENYQPLQIFSYAIEYHFFELKASGYHWVSLIMHIINTLLVFWLAYVLSGNKPVSFSCALLFGIHPMHVESVAWVSERKDLLYSMFFFFSLIYYVKYIRKNLSLPLYLFSLFLFAVSAFSKSMAVSLIPVLFLTDYYLNRKFSWKLVLEKLPHVILAVIIGIISVRNAVVAGSVDEVTKYSPIDRVFFACHNLLMYVVKLVIPFNQSGYYQYPSPGKKILDMEYYISSGLVLLLAVLIFFSMRKGKLIFFTSAFFVAAIALVLQLFPVGPNIFCERYSYVSSFAMYFLIGMGLVMLMEKNKNTLWIKTVVYTSVAAYSVLMILVTRERCEVYKNSITFWDDVILKNPKIPIAYNNRGNEYKQQGKYDKAIADLSKAIELKSDYFNPYPLLGDVYRNQGKYDLAMSYLNKALSMDPKSAEALVNHGIVQAVKGKIDSALIDFNLAIKYKPEMYESYGNRGNVYAILGKREEALSDYSKSLKLNPDFKDSYQNRALLYFESGKYDDSIHDFMMYFQKGGNKPEVYFQVAQSYAAKGDYVSALEYASQAQSHGYNVNSSIIQQWQQKLNKK